MRKRKAGSARPLVNRAIFMAIHPYLGQTVLCRSIFKRKLQRLSLRSPYDECGHHHNLFPVAQKAIEKVFPDQEIILHSGKQFSLSGMTGKTIQATVYHLIAPVPRSLLGLSDEVYIKISDHPMSAHITAAAATNVHPLPVRQRSA